MGERRDVGRSDGGTTRTHGGPTGTANGGHPPDPRDRDLSVDASVRACGGYRTLAVVRGFIGEQSFLRCEVQQMARSWRRHYMNRTPGEGKRAAKELTALYNN